MRRISLRRQLPLLVLAIFTARRADAQHAYVAATNATVFSETEESQTQIAHSISIVNRSTVPVTVFGISLTGCENVLQRCEPQQMNLHVPASSRRYAIRVEPRNPDQAFAYRFGFSWRADSTSAASALGVLASSGDTSAQRRLAEMRHSDSLRAGDVGYTELSADAWPAIANRVAAIRAQPESIVVAPGNQLRFDQIRILVLDAQGHVLGRTRWVRINVLSDIVGVQPPGVLVARRPGRTMIHCELADAVQSSLPQPIPGVDIPFIVTGDTTAAVYMAPAPLRPLPIVTDPHAPVFAGRAMDADASAPLACLSVAVEDSTGNDVARAHTDAAGAFSLRVPHPGTYRVRFDMNGWASSFGPPLVGNSDDMKQQDYPVRFMDVTVVGNAPDPSGFQHALPATMRAQASAADANPKAVPLGGITLGGSSAHPILGIVLGTQPARTVWAQFVVDSTGRVDVRTLVVPPATSANDRTSLTYVLPRIGYSPARENGKSTCEMIRLEVNFLPRASR